MEDIIKECKRWEEAESLGNNLFYKTNKCLYIFENENKHNCNHFSYVVTFNKNYHPTDGQVKSNLIKTYRP